MAGLRPLRHATGSKTFRQRQYPAVTSGAIYIGDPVRVSSGVVKALGTSSAAVLGVATMFFDSNGKPPTHRDGIFKPAGSAGWKVQVADDPDIVFEVESDATVSASMIGAEKSVSAGTPTTAAGQSGYKLTAVASATDGQFTVIGASKRHDLDNDGVDLYAEVIIPRAHHVYGS